MREIIGIETEQRENFEGKIMNRLINEKQKTIDQYVRNGTVIVNFILLVCHILFSFFFNINNVDIMYCYNFISIVVYIVGFFVLRKKLGALYVSMVYIELLVFMILAVICLGWEFGFQQYCIGFITTALFTDFYMSSVHKLKKKTVIVMIMYVAMYIIMRIWTYGYEALYDVDNSLIERSLYIINTIISFIFLVMYSCFYSNTMFRLEKTLIDVANIDALTGLKNRRRMQELLGTSFEERKKEPYNMCIAIIDVDNFKKINDKYGHDAGDKALKALANILLSLNEEKKGFHVCRWGGEEFLILYRKYDKNKKQILSEFEELRQTVENNVIDSDGYEISYTITIGVAFCDNNCSVSEIIKRADRNLYRGKETGKNKVVSE